MPRDTRRIRFNPFGEYRAESELRYTIGVRVSWTRASTGAVLFVMCVPAWATVSSPVNLAAPLPGKIAGVASINDARTMQESLRHDVARHPGDFVVFATEAGATQFFATHRDDSEIETNPRIVARGVVGYWMGKTVVVLPWTSFNRF